MIKNLKSYLFFVFSVSLISLGVWLLIIFNYDPYKADLLTIIIFFASMFIWLVGILFLIIFYLRIKLSNNEVIYANIGPSIRQAILLTVVLVGLIILKSLRVLIWWDVILLITSVLLLEFFFRTKNLNEQKEIKSES